MPILAFQTVAFLPYTSDAQTFMEILHFLAVASYLIWIFVVFSILARFCARKIYKPNRTKQDKQRARQTSQIT